MSITIWDAKVENNGADASGRLSANEANQVRTALLDIDGRVEDLESAGWSGDALPVSLGTAESGFTNDSATYQLKDGHVFLNGSVTSDGASGIELDLFLSALPVGRRPSVDTPFSGRAYDDSAGSYKSITILVYALGHVSLAPDGFSIAAGDIVFLDGVSFIPA